MEKVNLKFHASKEVVEQVTTDKLDEILAKGLFTIIDVRSPQGILSQGSIPGAINIPLEEVKKQIDERNATSESLLNGSGPFLFCCTGGVMSYMAAIHAQENGLPGVHNLESGHSAWIKWKKAQKEGQLI
ncbi:MAG: rhodanese-like domain-containing protein [Flavobacteriaceae bacterium]|nr:MAG: rhodanese-like domain-containing protein [Flavobacteriaceae bacterium]